MTEIIIFWSFYFIGGISQQILSRISANSTEGHVANEFLNKVSEILGEDIVSKEMNAGDPYSIVDIFNESTIHHDTLLKHVISDSYQMKVVNLIENWWDF